MTDPVFTLRGTAAEQSVLQGALDACDFPWDLLRPGMGGKGWTSIPVEFADLSSAAALGKGLGGLVYVVVGRRATLGLYWYKGLIQIEATLAASDPKLAQTVFLAEGAHAVDDCYISDAQRVDLITAMHPSGAPDSHGWFDKGAYQTWMGEALMGAFVQAYAPSLYDASLFGQFAPHIPDPARVRRILTPSLAPPAPGGALPWLALLLSDAPMPAPQSS